MSRVLPHPGSVGGEQTPQGKSGALRAAIFGVNDGLVSNLSLIAGVAGARVSNHVILLAGIAGLLSGAFSMGAGEYISMRVQRELFERLIHLEAHELATEPDEELEELAEIYRGKGMPPELATEVATVLMRDPAIALETHAREELGLDPEQLGSPWGAAASSFLTFSFGALVPLVPFMITSGTTATVWSAILSALTLFVVGALVTMVTGKRFWFAGLRGVLVGAAAATTTFLIGRLIDAGI